MTAFVTRCRQINLRKGKRMKAKRQAKILDLIVKKEIGTQEELTTELERAGFIATQATVSRDIREMKLTKVAMSDGKLIARQTMICVRNTSVSFETDLFLWITLRIF